MANIGSGVCGTINFSLVAPSVRVMVSSFGCIGLIENWLESRAEFKPSYPLDFIAAGMATGATLLPRLDALGYGPPAGCYKDDVFGVFCWVLTPLD